MIYDTIQRSYDSVLRPHLPHRWGTKADVEVRAYRLLDLAPRQPAYKRGLVEAIEEYVTDGTVVDEIGAGRGVLTVRALRAGAAEVRAYEAASEMIAMAERTLDRNWGPGWRDRVDLRHAIVGDPKTVYGSLDGANAIPPSDLSDADVLVLDCEGAEASILPDLGSLPDVVICESHPYDGAPAEATADVLEDAGYAVSERPFQPDRDDKAVVVGERRGE